MKILIINLHSSHNAGDDVLTRVTVQQLKKEFPTAVLTLAMNDPASYTSGDGAAIGSFATWIKSFEAGGGWRLSGFFWLAISFWIAVLHRLTGRLGTEILPKNKRPLLNAYFEADAVVSGAGNFLYSSGKLGGPFLIAMYTMAYARLAGKPLYSMPQTIGPLHRGWEKRLTRWIAGKMRLLFVRDAISQALLENIGAWGNNGRLCPDIAFAFPPSPPEAGAALLQAQGADGRQRPLLGVTLINWGAQNHLFTEQAAYETAVAETIRFFADQQNGQIILFSQVRGPTTADDDRIPARRVKEALDDLGTQVVLIEGDPSPETLKAAYAQMDLFIGSRLHSNIFALSEGVPAIMIQYQYKTRGVMQMLGLEEWVIEIEATTTPALTALLEKLAAEETAVRARLQRKMPLIIEEASEAAAAIAADFASVRKKL